MVDTPAPSEDRQASLEDFSEDDLSEEEEAEIVAAIEVLRTYICACEEVLADMHNTLTRIQERMEEISAAYRDANLS